MGDYVGAGASGGTDDAGQGRRSRVQCFGTIFLSLIEKQVSWTRNHTLISLAPHHRTFSFSHRIFKLYPKIHEPKKKT